MEYYSGSYSRIDLFYFFIIAELNENSLNYRITFLK